MNHFWLDDDQRIIMDAATGTASDYGAIGLVNVANNSMKQIRDLTGTDVSKDDQFRIYKITNCINFREHGAASFKRYSTAVRLTKNQAMLLKLRRGGDANIFVAGDSTGEIWGNMKVGLADKEMYDWTKQGEHFRRFYSGTLYQCFTQMLSGNGFGPSLASVGNVCAGMPVSWARCFVWQSVAQTHLLQLPVTMTAVEAASRGFDRTPSHRMTICRDLLDLPIESQGQAAARLFAMNVQRFDVRARFGLEGDPGEIL